MGLDTCSDRYFQRADSRRLDEFDGIYHHSLWACHVRSRTRSLIPAAVVALCGLGFHPVRALADDVQLWTVARVDQHLTERWAGQLLARFRFDDDVSRPKDFMLRTLSHWELGAFDVGVGYDYVYSFVNSSTIEHRPFQLAEHRWQPEFLRGISIKNRVRLDERFRADADGVIARLRYRLRFGRRIGSRWYVVMSDELFANLNDRGSGPPHMFEQNRLRLATGREIVPGLRVELGYEWQLSAGRDRANIDRHVFLVSLFAAPATYRAGRGD